MGAGGSWSADQGTVKNYGNALGKFKQHNFVCRHIEHFNRRPRMGTLYNREASGDRGGTLRAGVRTNDIFTDA